LVKLESRLLIKNTDWVGEYTVDIPNGNCSACENNFELTENNHRCYLKEHFKYCSKVGELEFKDVNTCLECIPDTCVDSASGCEDFYIKTDEDTRYGMSLYSNAL